MRSKPQGQSPFLGPHTYFMSTIITNANMPIQNWGGSMFAGDIIVISLSLLASEASPQWRGGGGGGGGALMESFFCT